MHELLGEVVLHDDNCMVLPSPDNFWPAHLRGPVLDIVVRSLPMSRDGKCNQLPCCCRLFGVVWRRQLRRVLRKYMDQVHDNMEERNKGTHLRAHWHSTLYYSSIDTIGMHLHASIRDLLGMRIDDWCPDMEEDNFDMAWQHNALIQEQEEAEDPLWDGIHPFVPNAAYWPGRASNPVYLAQSARRREYGRQMRQRLPGIGSRDYDHPNGQVGILDLSLPINQQFQLRDL